MTTICFALKRRICPAMCSKIIRHYANHDVGKPSKKSLRLGSYRPVLGLEKSEITLDDLIGNVSKKHFASNGNSLEMWSSIEKDAIQTARGITSYNFDGLMMIFLRSNKMFFRAQTFINYLEYSGRAPNDVVLANFMVLAADSNNESKALQTYEQINKSLLVVPAMVYLVVQGLLKTSHWKSCLQLLGNLNEVHIPSWLEVATAAFKNGDVQSGMQLINEIKDSAQKITNKNITVWLQMIMQSKTRFHSQWLMEQLLMCLRSSEEQLELSNSYLLQQAMERCFHMNVSHVSMDENGACPSCGRNLECPSISAEEHSELREMFLRDRLAQGSESYQESHPKELSFFLDFLEKAKPYDIVVDGLNVAHTQKYKHPAQLAQQLLTVVSQLKEQGYSPLVLGRKHIWHWEKRTARQIEELAKCFYADNISSDDPFMIYAALAGGPSTLFMTSDMLRDHYFLLSGDRFKNMFHRWCISRKVFFTIVNGKVEVKLHQKFGIYVQGDWKKGWHIPYGKLAFYKTKVPYLKQNNYWLCCRRH